MLDVAVTKALDSREQAMLLRVPFAVVGQPVRVTFQAAGAPRIVAHGFGDIPDGFVVGDQTAPVYRVPGASFTKELAYLTSPVANTEATLLFFKWKETPLDV